MGGVFNEGDLIRLGADQAGAGVANFLDPLVPSACLGVTILQSFPIEEFHRFGNAKADRCDTGVVEVNPISGDGKKTSVFFDFLGAKGLHSGYRSTSWV